MSMKKSILAGSAALMATAAIALAGAAVAQARQQAVSNQPIAVGADSTEYTGGGFALRGRAEVQQGDNRMRADAITGVSAPSGGISSVTATGNVYYVTPTETIRGDNAVYSVSTSTIVVTGDVILTQGRNVMTGKRLTYNIDTRAAAMDAGSGGRVQGVFYPQSGK